MKLEILGILGALLCSCASHSTVSPKPDIQPVVVSNQATRKSIASSQTHNKKTQEVLKQQGSNLDMASDDLKKLLK